MGQKVGYARCQAADEHGLNGAAQGAGSGQPAFDSTKKQERQQGDGEHESSLHGHRT